MIYYIFLVDKFNVSFINRAMNKLITVLVVSALASVAALADNGCQPCDESDWDVARGFAAAGDVLVVRPIAAAATVGAFGIFAVASPFAAMADAAPQLWETLVQNPGEYAFTRDLGDWSR